MKVEVIKKTTGKTRFLVSLITENTKVKDITGKNGETVLVYNDGKAERHFFAGLGKKKGVTTEIIKRAIALAVQKAKSLNITGISVELPDLELPEGEITGAIVAGAGLIDYNFYKYITDKKRKKKSISKISIICDKPVKAMNAVIKKELVLTRNVNMTRDLINENAADKTPKKFASFIQAQAKKHKLKCTILNESQMEKLGMGMLLGVSRGSVHPPRLVFVEYNGSKSKERTAMVGKGITFDAGGLNLKPTGHIETMKEDMSGAATVLGAVISASELKLKKNLIGVMPLSENMPGMDAQKPGDVVKSYSGQTVEIGNTDAEGRLVLGDAISYTIKKYKPAQVIDLATLTGAVVVALGKTVAGILGNNDKLIKELIAAGEKTDEKLWQLPLYDDYREALKSEIADFKNIGIKYYAGTITAAAFLEKFVGKTKWAHLDIAGTAYSGNARHYLKSGATGFGVRLLVEFLSS